MKPHYGWWLTTDLRIAIFVIGCICVVSFIIFGLIMLSAVWRDRNEDWVHRRPVRLPQDDAVRVVPFDQDAPFDWQEWEDKLNDNYQR